jgi:hypothetical protein
MRRPSQGTDEEFRIEQPPYGVAMRLSVGWGCGGVESYLGGGLGERVGLWWKHLKQSENIYMESKQRAGSVSGMLC